MMKRLLLIVVGVFVVIFIYQDLTAGSTKTSSQSNELWEQIYQEMTMDTSIHKLLVDTDVVSMRIEPSLDDLIHIRAESELKLKELKENFNLSLEEHSGELSITIESTKKKYNFANWGKTKQVEVIVQLPPALYEHIQLTADIGNIQHTQVDTRILEVKNDVGEIQIQNTNTEMFNAEGSIGAIKVHEVSGRTDIHNSAGLVEMHVSSIEEDIHIHNDVGAVRLTVEEQPEHIALDLSTDLGTIHSNLDIKRSEDTKTSVQGKKGMGDPTIKVKTSIGKIELHHVSQ